MEKAACRKLPVIDTGIRHIYVQSRLGYGLTNFSFSP